MKRAVLLSALLLTLPLAGCSMRADTQKTVKSVFAMDTYMELTAYGECGDALDAAEDRIRALEQMLSATDAGSEIWAANHADGSAVPISADTAAILREASAVHDMSGGALSVSVYPVVQAWGFTTGTYRVPEDAEVKSLLQNVDDTRISYTADSLTVPADMQIDLGALAKGYTGDAVISMLRDAGVTSAILNLGGNVQALGSKPDGSAWMVGIAHPFAPEKELGTVRITDCAAVTSGNYERFFTDDSGVKHWHIIDPADGYPADNGLVSVTVIGRSGLHCDALSTALFVEGTERAAAHWRKCADFEMVLVTDGAEIYVTEGIADVFTNQSDMPVKVLKK